MTDQTGALQGSHKAPHRPRDARWSDISHLTGWNLSNSARLKRWIGYGKLKGMKLSKADEFRLPAEKCLDQAEIAPDEMVKKRMTWLADEWLRMAYEAALQEDGARGLVELEASSSKGEL